MKGKNSVRTTEDQSSEDHKLFYEHLQHSKKRGGELNYTSTPNPSKKIKCTLHTLIKPSFKMTGETPEYDILIGYAGHHHCYSHSTN